MRELTLVESGRPATRVVCFRDSGPIESVAITLLQKHLKERTGMELPCQQIASFETLLQESPRSHLEGIIIVGTHSRLAGFPPFRALAGELANRLGPEGFYLGFAGVPGLAGHVLLLIGADERGVLYGVGKLLRSTRFGCCSAVAEIGEICTTPATKVRGHLIANHIWSPQYDNWDEQVWEDYLADLSLWGVNTVLANPYHPGEWAACKPFDSPPVFTNDKVRSAWEFYWRVQQAVPAIARKYGMSYGLWIPPNDVPVDEAKPPRRPLPGEPVPAGEGGRCDNVCPSDPEMRALIIRHRERLFKALDRIDLLIVPASDCGGCACPKCAPWVKTLVGLSEEIAEKLRVHHPDAWMGISNQNISEDENNWLFKHLTDERPGWLGFVVFGPGSCDIGLMRREIPADYDIFLYPDNTHLSGTPGYLFEDVATDPLVWRVYQQSHLEAMTYARPAALARAYKKFRQHSQGSFPYSEGTHDDLNKVIWSQLDWDQTYDVWDVVRSYSQFYFGHAAAGQAVMLWDRHERGLSVSPDKNEEIDNSLAVMESMKRRLPSWALFGWRWKLLELRVLLDRFLRLYQQMNERVGKALEACLEMERPDLAIRNMATRVRESGPRPVIDDLRIDLGVMFPYYAGAETARRERHEFGEFPVPPLEHELDSWTDALREMEFLDNRVQVLMSTLRDLIGLELRAAWIIRRARTCFDTRLDRLEAVACSPDNQDLKRLIRMTLNPEEVETGMAGSTYDDLGHPHKQPHLKEGRAWEAAFGDSSLRGRPAEERRAVSPSGRDLVLEYEGLDSSARYEIQVTYAETRYDTRTQCLVATSSQGSYEVHRAFLLPSIPRCYTFLLPEGFVADGKLTLSFKWVDGHPRNAVASEVRLCPISM